MDWHERITSDAAAHAAAGKGLQAGLWTALPGIIQSASLGQDGQLTGTVQPAIQARILNTDGTRSDVTLPLCVDVPLVFPRGGGYTLSFPVGANDEALIIFSSRCIDNWWQNGGVQPQHELRFHDLSDGFALVGPFSQSTKIANVSTTTTQLRSDDGTLYTEIDAPNKKVNLVSNGISVILDSNVSDVAVAGSTTVHVSAADQITLTSPLVRVEGNLDVTGLVRDHVDGAAVGLGTHDHGNTGTLAGGTHPPRGGS